jgi:hypothetical protein
MSGVSWDGLPRPVKSRRLDLLVPDFETEEFCRNEDALRAKLLRQASKLHGGQWGKRARKLADRIDPALNPKRPKTLASSRYWRRLRKRIVGDLLKLVEQDQTGIIRRADIIPKAWACDLDGLSKYPKLQLQSLRSRIVRAGGGKGPGFLVMTWHADMGAESKVFQRHAHLLATGSYVAALESLVGAKGLQADSITDWGTCIHTPVIVRKQQLFNPARAIGYLPKGYWLSTWAGGVSGTGTDRRARTGTRLPEPYHTEMLLWLDDHKIGDLVLTMGLKITTKGLILK